MKNITFSREPAVYIGLVGAVIVAVINSGAFPAVTANAAAYSTLVTLVVGILIRFFVTPNGGRVPAPPVAPDAPLSPPTK